MILDTPHPELSHPLLATTFVGVEHPLSTLDTRIHQFRGIKYASVPARFRQSKPFTSYGLVTDASRYGPICPQQNYKSLEEDMFELSPDASPTQSFKQSEFECLNLNITCPAGLNHDSAVPVMIWIHGGGDRGTGSNWVFDGGAFVRKSLLIGKPIIMVSINFRIGLLGFAASPAIREDNRLAGDEGVGNYGLRDQIRAFEWVHYFIRDFGGDPSNVTLFGQSSGAADIIHHLLSSTNKTQPLFHRAIVQSAIFDYNLPDVHTAGSALSRIMSVLRISGLDQLRSVELDRLVGVGMSMRATDDGVFLRPDWRDVIHPVDRRIPSRSKSKHHSRSQYRRGTYTLNLPAHLQPLIIGDCAYDSLLWSLPVSFWTAPSVVRRLKAVCQSLAKATALLYGYDISPHSTPEELVQGVLELVNDARVSWPTECVAEGTKMERGGKGVWRYVFDQEGPLRGVPHHAADLIYLFDNMPLPPSLRHSPSSTPCPDTFYDGSFGYSDDEDEVEFRPVDKKNVYDIDGDLDVDEDEDEEDGGEHHWTVPHVDAWSYARVRDAIQERWISFAHGESPWDEEKVYVFGPEGETGERSGSIFEGRRRRATWKEVLEPMGMQLVQKVGVELSRGPPLSGVTMRG